MTTSNTTLPVWHMGLIHRWPRWPRWPQISHHYAYCLFSNISYHCDSIHIYFHKLFKRILHELVYSYIYLQLPYFYSLQHSIFSQLYKAYPKNPPGYQFFQVSYNILIDQLIISFNFPSIIIIFPLLIRYVVRHGYIPLNFQLFC